MKNLLFVLHVLFSLCSGTAIAQKSLKTEKIIRELEEKRRQANLSDDTARLAAILAPEFYEIGRLGKFRTREQNLQERASGKLRIDSLSLDSIQVKVFGNIAIATGIVQGKGMYGGEPFKHPKMRYSRIYLYRKGEWQNVFAQNTEIAGN